MMVGVKKKLIFIYLTLISPLIATPSMDFAFDQSENLVINNRILLKINGKPISVMDVVRKMDLLFYRQFPDLASSMMARYQFYMNAWRTVLGAVIDDHLIMADAEEKKVEINDGEVREELEILFGPDVVLNLDKMGMTLEEAFNLLKTELIVQRMTGMMVRSKSMTEVHPKRVRKRYEKVLAENPPQNYMVYQIVSIRGPEHEKVAQEAHRLISEQKVPFSEIATHLEDENIEISVSEEYRQAEQNLSLAYKAILETLSIGVTSTPVSNKTVSRLFCLKEVEKVKPESFRNMEDELKKELSQEAFARYNQEYREKLRKHYGITDKYLRTLIPDKFQPFALR